MFWEIAENKINFLSGMGFSVQSASEQSMESCENMKQEKPKKRKPRRSSDNITRSNVLKYIILSLVEGLHKHVLYWWDVESKVFEIIFVHKSNNNWNESCLDLFKELDKTSKQYGRYLEEKDYECGCKRRCRANLRKLCKGKIFTEIKLDRKKLNVDKSIIIKRYKINIEDFSKLNLEDFAKQLKRNILKCADKIQSKTGTKIDNTVKSCAQSHFLCLSDLVESAESRLLDAQNTVYASISNKDQYAEKSETVGCNEFLFSNTNDVHQFSEVEYTESRSLEARNAIDCASISNYDHYAEKRGTARCNEFPFSNTNDVHKLSEVEYAESRLLDARNTVYCASISNYDHYAEKSETVGFNEFTFSNTSGKHEFSEVEMARIGGMELKNSQNTMGSASMHNSELNAEKREALRFNQSQFKFPSNCDFHKLPKVEMAGIGVRKLKNSQNTMDSTSTYNSELNAEKREALRFDQSHLKLLNLDFYELHKVEYAESRLLDARNTVDCASISNYDHYAEKSEMVGYNNFIPQLSYTSDMHEFSEDSVPSWYEKFCGISFKDAIERDDPFLPSAISTTEDSCAPSHNYLTESEEWIEKFDCILEAYEDA